MASRIAHDRSLAEEATQDVFVQAWRDGFRYDPARGTVQAWLLTMAGTRTLDRLRAHLSRRGRAASVDAVDEGPARYDLNTPETLASASEDASALDSVLAVLPAADRHLIDLAYFKGLTHSEIAGELDQPLGTIKTHLRNLVRLLGAGVGAHPHPPFSWARRPGGPLQATAGALDDLTILVVDDDADTLRLLTFVLQQSGATVVPASSTDQALKRLGVGWPHMIVADLDMPGQDGYALIELARNASETLGRFLPAVAFSAHSDKYDRIKSASAGFDVHLAKPVQPSLLVVEIAELTHMEVDAIQARRRK